MKISNRREFLGGVGMTLSSAVGLVMAERLGFASVLSRGWRERLRFGALDPLVDLLQVTPADELMPLLVQKLRAGTPLAEFVGAGALANARAFGGTNYNGYHTLMAMMPSYEMAAQMPAQLAALPVLKVLHRNATFVEESGAASQDALAPLTLLTNGAPDAGLLESMRRRELEGAERALAAAEARSREEAYEELQAAVRADADVHRVVLSWRAYDLLRLTGEAHATTMLRQSLRFCVTEDGRREQRGQPPSELVTLVPRLMAEHGLEGRERGTRKADDAWVTSLADTLFSAERTAAAGAAAAALAEGFDPEDVGAAMSLAATRLLLNDPGRSDDAPGKPRGSVHGASVGVHASDAANAWRHIARVGSSENACASLIAGAFHTAGQGQYVDAQPHDHDAPPCEATDPAALRHELAGRVRERDQRGACRAARRYCELGHPAPELFALLLEFAVSEDGALHAEKYFRTAQEEHGTARAAHRDLYLVALTRVMASHFGFPAAGVAQARELLAHG